MRTWFKGLGALLAAAVLIGASPGTGGPTAYGWSESKSLAVGAVQQKASNWCWAAATQSILTYQFGITYCQNTQAANMFGATCTCGGTITSACNKSATLGQVQNLIENYKRVYTTLSGRDVTWGTFKSEINYGRPAWLRYGPASDPFFGVGHIVVVRAFYESSAPVKQLGMMDPNNVGNDRWPWYNWSYITNNSQWYWTNTLWKAYR